MAKKRKYHRYELKEGSKVVYRGITNDPQRREREHKEEGKQFSHMRVIGPSATKKTAEIWEEESLESYRRHHRGENPKYNKMSK
jgi:predicted GIY-YIG superfamily endonuclease